MFVGMLSKYIFRLSSVKERHRVSQVFIMPSYQKTGHGKELIDVVYDISLKNPNCFEITTEIPSFEYQCLRDFKELELITKSKIFNLEELKPMKTIKEINENRALLLIKDNVRKIKETLKIPGHQIERLTNIFLLYKIQKQNDDMVKAHFEQNIKDKIILNRSPFKTRKRLPHLTMYGKFPNLKDFNLEKVRFCDYLGEGRHASKLGRSFRATTGNYEWLQSSYRQGNQVRITSMISRFRISEIRTEKS